MKVETLGTIPALAAWVSAFNAYDVRPFVAFWYTKGREEAATLRAELRLGEASFQNTFDVAGLNVGDTLSAFIALMMKYTQLDETKTVSIGLNVQYTQSTSDVELSISEPSVVICKNCDQYTLIVNGNTFTRYARYVALAFHPSQSITVRLTPHEGGMEYAVVKLSPPAGRDKATLTLTELDASGNTIDQAEAQIDVYYVLIVVPQIEVEVLAASTNGYLG